MAVAVNRHRRTTSPKACTTRLTAGLIGRPHARATRSTISLTSGTFLATQMKTILDDAAFGNHSVSENLIEKLAKEGKDLLDQSEDLLDDAKDLARSASR